MRTRAWELLTGFGPRQRPEDSKRLFVVPGPGKGLPASPQPVLMVVVGCTVGYLLDQGRRRAASGQRGAEETLEICS
jgi:hypothetical protein